MIPRILPLLAGSCLAVTLCAQTNFTNADRANDLITNTANWDNGLPVRQRGTIQANAGYSSENDIVGFDVVHSSGSLFRRTGFGGLNLTQGTHWLLTGTAIIHEARGLKVTNGSRYIQEEGALADFTSDGRDALVSDSGSSVVINGGTFKAGRKLIVRNGATFTINDGVVSIGDAISTPVFATSEWILYLNGGSMTAKSFQLDHTGKAYFGGSSAGSLQLTAGFGHGVTLDWIAGSLMRLTVAGADETFYKGLYSSGTLLFEGTNSASFASIFKVEDDTISVIPEVSYFAFSMGVCAVAGFIVRRRPPF